MATSPNGPGPDTPARGGQGLRVLVVEDDADTAATLAEVLRLEGHEIRVALDGPAALAEATASPPDVVLLDIQMPGMDGWELARRLKGQAGGRHPLTVAVTGHGREEDRRQSREAGVDLHLLKPADPEDLCRLLRRFGQARDRG
jgi:two-component system, OmpR family, response regulator